MSNTIKSKIVALLAFSFGLGLNISFAAEFTTDLSIGKQLVEKNACQACHTIGKQGGLVGPNLNQVTLRRDDEWLLTWLTDPAAVKLGTFMPNFHLSEEEINSITDYLYR